MVYPLRPQTSTPLPITPYRWTAWVSFGSAWAPSVAPSSSSGVDVGSDFESRVFSMISFCLDVSPLDSFKAFSPTWRGLLPPQANSHWGPPLGGPWPLCPATAQSLQAHHLFSCNQTVCVVVFANTPEDPLQVCHIQQPVHEALQPRIGSEVALPILQVLALVEPELFGYFFLFMKCLQHIRFWVIAMSQRLKVIPGTRKQRPSHPLK